jgi:predicted acyltransferase
MGTDQSSTSRIVSLDQFRGYTVLGMFLVNYIGGFVVIDQTCPVLKHHHTYCSYADTIMPQFFFAVGFAYRLTLLRRCERDGAWAAYSHAISRNLGLILLGFVLYHLDGRYATWEELQRLTFWAFLANFKRSFFQTLVHIGVTSLWVLPVITARPRVRIAFAALSGLIHVVLSYGLNFWPFDIPWSNYQWVNADPRGIDGGPLGFLTWTIPLLLGSLAYDAIAASKDRPPMGKLFCWGLVVMLLGYGLSCLNRVTPPNSVSWDDPKALLVEPPFVPPTLGPDRKPVYTLNMWTMSQRSGSISYLTFGAGFSLSLYALFVLLCDVASLQVGIFRTLGSNALAGYILHGLVADAVKPYVPRDAPGWYVWASLGVFLAICYLFIRHLEKHRLYLKL